MSRFNFFRISKLVTVFFSLFLFHFFSYGNLDQLSSDYQIPEQQIFEKQETLEKNLLGLKLSQIGIKAEVGMGASLSFVSVLSECQIFISKTEELKWLVQVGLEVRI